MSVTTLATEGDGTITAASQTINLEIGKEIGVGKDIHPTFGNNKAHVLVIYRK